MTTALSRLTTEVHAVEPLNLESVRAIRAGAKRIHDNRLIAMADAALREICAPNMIRALAHYTAEVAIDKVRQA
jgi:hypothetical protein